MELVAKNPVVQKYAPPFLLNSKIYDILAEQPLLEQDVAIPLPGWTFARKRPNGGKLPQSIAHRGYKAKHPENTMGAFKGAVDVGANAIETDVHLSKDGVVVLSHDATLKRCFGKDEKIIDCDWDYLSQQRTLEAPHESMPKLKDLLEYLASPGLESTWVLLDIKLDNNANDVMRLIAEIIDQVRPHPSRPWNQRVVLGIWAAKYVPLCNTHLPTFPICYIGFSIPYARQFLHTPNISFNLFQKTVMAPIIGSKFLRDAKALGRPIFMWTVNDESLMKWSISRGADGVITDDPKRFLEVCDAWEHGDRQIRIRWRLWFEIIWLNIMVLLFTGIFWWKYGGLKRKSKGPVRIPTGVKSEGEEVT